MTFRDPLERRLAPLLQLILMVLVATSALAILLNVIFFGSRGVSFQALAPNLSMLVIFLVALALLRRGYLKMTVWFVVATLMILQARIIFTTSIESYGEMLLVFLIPLTVTGVMISRRALISMTLLSFAIILLDMWSEQGTITPSNFYIFMTYMIVVTLVGFFIDLCGTAFRKELAIAVTRTNELTGLHESLEVHANNVLGLKEQLEVTLRSIGDAVITTDLGGHVMMLNTVAEELTGWTDAEAKGQPLESVFHIVNETTRLPVENPVTKVLQQGAVVGLANHTILLGKHGREIPIDDSGAPIRDQQGNLIGVVLVFRNIEDRTKAEHQANILQQLTADLSRSITVKEVTDAMLHWMTLAMSAELGMVSLMRENKQELDIVNSIDIPGEIIARLTPMPVDSSTPLTDSIRTGKPVWIANLSEYQAQYPDLINKIQVFTGSQAVIALPIYLDERSIGSVSIAFQRPVPFDEQDARFLMTLTQQCAQAIERARLHMKEQETRLMLQVRVRQQSLVSELGLVALRFDLHTLEAKAMEAVTQGLEVDYAKILELLPDGNELLLRAGLGWQDGVVGQARLSASTESQPGYTLLTKKPVIVEDLRTETRFTDLLLLHSHQVISGMTVIIEYRDRIFGALGVHTRQKRIFTQDDIFFLQSVANIIGAAVEREQTSKAEQAARQRAENFAHRLSRLQSVTNALSDTLTTDDVAKVAIDQSVAVLGADFGSFSLELEDKATFALVYTVNSRTPPDQEHEWSRYPADPAYPIPDAVQRRQALWFTSIDEAVARYPSMAPFAHLYPGAAIFLPVGSKDQLSGGIALSFMHQRIFTEEERTFMLTIAAQCAQALERARLYDAERKARTDAERAWERTRQLQELTASLSEALTSDEIATVIMESGVSALNASAGTVVILSSDGAFLETIATTGYSIEAVDPWKRFPITIRTPLTDSIHIQEALWISSQEMASRYPMLAGSMNSIYTAWAVIPLVVYGKTIGALGFSFLGVRDFGAEEREFTMTIARHCAQALQRAGLYEAESAARERAEEADKLKLQFLGMISHELRTPLTSIKGFATILLADKGALSAARLNQFYGVINEETDKLAELIEQLLNMTRVQAGTLDVSTRPERLQTAFELVNVQIDTLTVNHHLVIDIPPDLPLVQIDPGRIAQVLANLVGNAAKFSPAGSDVMISATLHSGFIRVVVRDYGSGIPRELHKDAFEPFRQVGVQDPAQRKGTGLGLAICKHIIEAHGGEIWIDAEVQSGTAIVFTLPLTYEDSTG